MDVGALRRRVTASVRTRRDQAQDLVAPHLRVPRRGETVEEPGVGAATPRLQGRDHLGDGEVEGRALVGEVDAGEAPPPRPLGQEGPGQARQFRPGGQGPGGG